MINNEIIYLAGRLFNGNSNVLTSYLSVVLSLLVNPRPLGRTKILRLLQSSQKQMKTDV